MKAVLHKVVALTVMGLIFLSLGSQNLAKADYWPNGGRSSAKFNAYYDSSVASFGYTAAFDRARGQWNGIGNPNVYIGKTTSSSGFPDKYYVGTIGSSPRSVGATTHYSASGNLVGPNVLYAYSTVALFDTPL